MEEKKKSPPPSKKRDPEVTLALFLILFICCIVVFTMIFVFRTVFADSGHPDDSESETTETGNDPNQPTTPVFSEGTLIRPEQTDRTAQITQTIHSEYAALINAETGEILAVKNASQRFAPASMTKVMTLIVACEHLTQTDLDRKVTFTQDAFDYVTSGSYTGTEQVLGRDYIGDSFQIRDLLYGIGVSSAADCTYLICREVSDSEEAFVNLMNAKALELGLSDTHFDNVIGYESANNYTTACDMAAIMSYAMQSDLIRQILCTKDAYPYRGYYEKDGVETSYRRYFSSTLNNRLTTYQNTFGSSFRLQTATLLGGKTGYLKENGVINNCLVSYLSATSDGTEYVLVLGCNNNSSAYTMQDVKTIADAYIH